MDELSIRPGIVNFNNFDQLGRKEIRAQRSIELSCNMKEGNILNSENLKSFIEKEINGEKEMQ